jgi:CBS domain-containing protein
VLPQTSTTTLLWGWVATKRWESNLKAREIMTTNVVSVRDDNTVEDAARMLARHRIGGLPVVNTQGALVGLLTEYDLISKQGHRVADIMSRSVISVSPDTDTDAIAHLLASHHFRRVPVVENGAVVGIVSQSDLVRQIAMRWVCSVCGEVVRSAAVPAACPRCGAEPDAFVHEVEPPGM